MTLNYKSIFQGIESSVMNSLNVEPAIFIGRLLPFKDTKYWNFKYRTNENIFWVLCYVTFFGQNDPAHIIEDQFDTINKLLCDGSEDHWIKWEVNFNKLSSLSINEKNRLIKETLKFGRWGSIKGTDFSGEHSLNINRYLKWIIENAFIFSDLIKHHNNSFAEYVRKVLMIPNLQDLELNIYDANNPRTIELHSDMKKRFRGLGEPTPV